jgi:hypothetical protein
MIKFYLIDLDDFCEINTDWELIENLKEKIPNLKLNLFAIPGQCSMTFLDDMREYDWIRLYPHGYMHSTSREFENWGYKRFNFYLGQLERGEWPKLWKSPGWQSSQDVLQCLADREWAIADQEYNNQRRPENLRAYLLDAPYKIHGHIGHWGAKNENSLEFIFDQIASLEGEFGFIDDLWK